MRDHPGMGGEKNKELEGVWLPMGSPPHGRGKEIEAGYKIIKKRITPALAGKSREIPLHLRAAKDHPRVGGEKSVQLCERKGCPGSPPRRRGKVHQNVAGRLYEGITPA